MISQLRRIANKATITLDHYIDKDGDMVYKWRAKVKDKIFVPTRDSKSFDDCVHNLIETVTPYLSEEKDETRTS